MMDYLNRLALTLLCMMLFISLMTSILTFLGVKPILYQPYLFFIIALVILSFILPPSPTTFLL
jgi:hypothetical protein